MRFREETWCAVQGSNPQILICNSDGQDTQGGTQIPPDPILARLVATWPNLSEQRKKFIYSLADLPPCG